MAVKPLPLLSPSLTQVGVKQYVQCLEDSVIAACGELGVRAHTSEYTGVWVGCKKVSAIGTVIAASLCHRYSDSSVLTTCSLGEEV